MKQYLIPILITFMIIGLFYVRYHRSRYSRPNYDTTKTILEFSRFLKIAVFLLRIIVFACLLFGAVVFAIDVSLFYFESRGDPGMQEGTIDEFLRNLSFLLIPILYLIIFFVPSVLGLPIALTVAIRWRQPGRFLILRPFHHVQATRIFKRLVRMKIGYLGHTFTLSDTTIKIPWYVRFPIFVGQLGFLQFRLRKIDNYQKISYLEKQLNNRWLRTINWCFSWNKIFSIRTDDNMWQKCITIMIPLMDVIIIDISDIKQNVIWEIEQCLAMGEEHKMIFLCSGDTEVSARQWVQDQRKGQISNIPMFVYGKRDMNDPSELINKILEMTPGKFKYVV